MKLPRLGTLETKFAQPVHSDRCSTDDSWKQIPDLHAICKEAANEV